MTESANTRDGRAVIIRTAVLADGPALEALIDASIHVLGGRYYSESEIESSMRYVFGVDTTMIQDGTYVVVEHDGQVIGAGGWSHRKTPFGGDQATPVRDAEFRQPGVDPAVIRAMFVHPDWARQGVGGIIMQACENRAYKAGFIDLELVATLSGVAFYEHMGYTKRQTIQYRMADGSLIDFVEMDKVAKAGDPGD